MNKEQLQTPIGIRNEKNKNTFFVFCQQQRAKLFAKENCPQQAVPV
jgi:hypothetical protein